MIEETLKIFNLDPDREARIRRIIEEFDLERKVEEAVSFRTAVKGIRSGTKEVHFGDKDLIEEIYDCSIARKALTDYVSYSQTEIADEREPVTLAYYIRSVVRNKNGEVVFINRKGDFCKPLYNKYQTEKHWGKTEHDLFPWLRELAKDNNLMDTALGQVKDLEQIARDALNSYISYAKSEIAEEREPFSLVYYIRNAVRKEDGKVEFVSQKGDFYKPLYAKNIKEKTSSKTQKDLYDWLKEKSNNDELFNQAIQLESLYTGTNSYTPVQLINYAFQKLQIPTDASSLSNLVDLLSGEENSAIVELVDLLYLIRPSEILALEKKKISRSEITSYLKEHLRGESGETTTEARGIYPFHLLTNIVPFETYQKEAVVRSHLLDIALRNIISHPYEISIHRISGQIAANPDDKVLEAVLTETKSYLDAMHSMPKSITSVGT